MPCSREWVRLPCEIITARRNKVQVNYLFGNYTLFLEKPFGRPLVPLESTRYARVFFVAGRIETSGTLLRLT